MHNRLVHHLIGTVEPSLKTTLIRRPPCYKDHFQCTEPVKFLGDFQISIKQEFSQG